MDEHYFLEVDTNGCPHCGRGRTWNIIGPDGAALGMRWTESDEDRESGEPPEDAAMMCEAMNEAFATGQANPQLREGGDSE